MSNNSNNNYIFKLILIIYEIPIYDNIIKNKNIVFLEDILFCSTFWLITIVYTTYAYLQVFVINLSIKWNCLRKHIIGNELLKKFANCFISKLEVDDKI